MLLIAGIIIIFFLIYYFFKRKFIFVNTVSPAIVMSFGIFSLHVEPAFYLNIIWSQVVAFIAILLWIFFIISFIFSAITEDFLSLHYENIIGRFRIGTWIASTSVVVMIIGFYFPELDSARQPLVFMNTLLWIIFCVIAVSSIYRIIKENKTEQVNGILLLTTVSTQSIVLMYSTVWQDSHSLSSINHSFIIIGLLFYLFCFILLAKRYTTMKWSLTEDWFAPNCMFHGALSITGAAMIVSDTFSPAVILIVWCISFLIFIIVEIMEIIRGVLRAKKYGFKRGLCVYEASQWSRIFTFCMFYMFTLKFNNNYSMQTNLITASQDMILRYGKWVIACLLIIEVILFIPAHLYSPKGRNTSGRVQMK